MTFPRPCLYALLAACLLLPGCVANQYAIKINAITNGDIQAGIGDVYYIMAVKGQEDDLVFLELKRNLESALPQAGLKVTKSLPHATAVLFAGYKSQTVARQTTVSEPVYGVTRVETRGTGEYINTLTGKTSKTSVSHLRRYGLQEHPKGSGPKQDRSAACRRFAQNEEKNVGNDRHLHRELV